MVELIISWCIATATGGQTACANSFVEMPNVTEFQCAIVAHQHVVKWAEENKPAVVKRWTCKYRELSEFAVKGE